MEAPPDVKSVRKLDRHIETRGVALGMAGGSGERRVRDRVNRIVFRQFEFFMGTGRGSPSLIAGRTTLNTSEVSFQG